MVKIHTPELLHDGGDVVVSARISGITPAGTMRFRLPAMYAPSKEAMADAMLPAGLLLAMATGQTLELQAPVSKLLLKNSYTVQDIFSSWHPKKMKRVQVLAPRRTSQPKQASKLALSTFTGGVDSFYTLDKNAEEISSVLFVHGFDVKLKDVELRARMSAHLKAASNTAGKTLIEGSSNIRRFLNPHLTWSKIAHGAVITSFVMLLSSHHDRFYFPASYSYADLYPWGSHPLVDPLWSTEYLNVIHDGAEASRVDKTLKIAENPSAQRHLRICFQKKGEYNCGVCSKCIRTKIALSLAGVLERFETLDNTIDLDALRQLGIKSESDRIFAQENLDFARQQSRDDIAQALGDIIESYNSRGKKSRSGLRVDGDSGAQAVLN
ncbi:hypothetical protein ACTXMB_09820 [Arthrobacter rhombi]|uniref:hypothetical protein n=1 Tax=Arthrobacter rhombi TaxID=71253 RepID=UPI003FD1ACC6